MTTLNSSDLENLSFNELFDYSVSDFLLGDKDSPNSPNAGLDQVILFFSFRIIFDFIFFFSLSFFMFLLTHVSLITYIVLKDCS